MGTLAPVKLRELRDGYRLIGECTELGADSLAWRRHWLDGLCRLSGARIGLALELFEPLAPTEQGDQSLLLGGAETWQWRLWQRYLRFSACRREDPFHLHFFRHFNGALLTRRRDAIVSPTLWYGSLHYHEFVRPSGLDDRIASAVRLPGGAHAAVQLFILQRAASDGPYPSQASRLIRLLHHELFGLLGRRLLMQPEHTPPVLPPRLLQILACLLEGYSDKQIARRLGISHHTVNHHIQRLYRLFGVHARGELLRHCLQHSCPVAIDTHCTDNSAKRGSTAQVTRH
jgi:DNA-binding CsgD family transcriptional regulator